MNKKDKLLIFIISFIVAFFFWRGWVFFNSGKVSVLRSAIGLNIHHYHYGILFVLIAFLMILFYGLKWYFVVLAGFGFGSYFDGFVSRLLGSSLRSVEIVNYNTCFPLTIILFLNVILLVMVFYFFGGERYELL